MTPFTAGRAMAAAGDLLRDSLATFERAQEDVASAGLDALRLISEVHAAAALTHALVDYAATAQAVPYELVSEPAFRQPEDGER